MLFPCAKYLQRTYTHSLNVRQTFLNGRRAFVPANFNSSVLQTALSRARACARGHKFLHSASGPLLKVNFSAIHVQLLC